MKTRFLGSKLTEDYIINGIKVRHNLYKIGDFIYDSKLDFIAHSMIDIEAKLLLLIGDKKICAYIAERNKIINRDLIIKFIGCVEIPSLFDNYSVDVFHTVLELWQNQKSVGESMYSWAIDINSYFIDMIENNAIFFNTSGKSLYLEGEKIYSVRNYKGESSGFIRVSSLEPLKIRDNSKLFSGVSELDGSIIYNNHREILRTYNDWEVIEKVKFNINIDGKILNIIESVIAVYYRDKCKIYCCTNGILFGEVSILEVKDKLSVSIRNSDVTIRNLKTNKVIFKSNNFDFHSIITYKC